MRRTAIPAVAVALLITGCQSGDTLQPTAPVTVTATVTESTPREPEGPPSSAGTDPEPIDSFAAQYPWGDETVESDPVSDGEAAGQEITGVRMGTHDGFDRVVLDLSGDEPVLGWDAHFVEDAMGDPSGEPVEMEGEVFLDLEVSGIDWVEDSAERYTGTGESGKDTVVVTEVRFDGLFEGHQQVLIGLREQTSFRIFALRDPARIVVDVQHP